MRRTPANLPEIQDKRAAVIRLRAEGRTWQQVADLAGYSTASGALKAWRKAVQQHPDQTVDEVRAQEKTRLEQMDSVMAGILANPPLRGTATGAVMLDVRTCSCGSRSDKRRDHTDDCEIAPVLDAAAIIRASAERRALGESLRRLVNADVPAASAPLIDARTQILNSLNEDRAAIGWGPLVIPPNPTGYTMPAAEAAAAADAAIAKLRNPPGGGLFVPPGVVAGGLPAINAWVAEQQHRAQRTAAIPSAVVPQPGDDNVVDAEIVE